MRGINRLTKVAVVATGIVCLFLFCAANLGLALVAGVGDVVVWEVPFTGREVRLPDWMWPVAIYGMLASIPILIVLWSAVAVNTWKRKRRIVV
jgi:hypothetical protein